MNAPTKYAWFDVCTPSMASSTSRLEILRPAMIEDQLRPRNVERRYTYLGSTQRQ